MSRISGLNAEYRVPAVDQYGQQGKRNVNRTQALPVNFGEITRPKQGVEQGGFVEAVKNNPVFAVQPKADGKAYETRMQNYLNGMGGDSKGAATTHNGKDGFLGNKLYAMM